MSEAQFTAVPLSPLRQIIAARMTHAKQEIPHFRLMMDLEIDALLAQRKAMNVAHPDARVSLNDCLLKACASALMEHPAANSQLVGSELRQYHQADIAVVVAVEGGVSTPVIREANTKSLREISIETRALVARAARRQLRLDEITGGSFSISNLGMYGVEQFDAIINAPQCAILAIGCAKPRYVLSAQCEPRVATLLTATLSVDHRALDGATAAAFLGALRRLVEQPASWLLAGNDRGQ